MKSLRRILIPGIALCFIGLAFPAQAATDEHQQRQAKMREIAGLKGPYTAKEHFPADYFLVHGNLPHLIGLALYHPRKDELALDEQQVHAMKNIEQKTVPVVTGLAATIKQAELDLAERLMHTPAPLEELHPLVDAIAARRAELTRAHLACIREVRNALQPEQFTALLGYAASPAHP